MQIKLNNVRLAFPSLFEAKAVNGEGEPRFSASFIMQPDDTQIEKVRDVIKAVAKAKWGEKAEAMLTSLEKKNNICLHDGDDKTEYDGFAGNMYVSAANKSRPTVVDKDRSPLTIQDGKPYSGCYVNAVIDIWAQDNNFGKRINAVLAAVQFSKDGDAFGGGVPVSADVFDIIEDDAESLI